MSKIKFINLADLNLPEFQAHSDTPREQIQELAESIKQIGIIEPLIVIDSDQGIEIVAGCLRYHAAILAGLKAAPCINMSLDPKSAEILKLHENVKRIPLDHIDQGMTFIMMMEEFNMTEKSISECVGKSIAYISQHVSLVRIDNELTKSVKDGSIIPSQARELMRLNDKDERMRLLSFCQNDGATVQVLQRWVQESLHSIPYSSSSKSSSPSSFIPLQTPEISRNCQACGNSVKIGEIQQVIFCPSCAHAILTAISDEKKKISPNTPEKDSQDTSG